MRTWLEYLGYYYTIIIILLLKYYFSYYFCSEFLHLKESNPPFYHKAITKIIVLIYTLTDDVNVFH